jgi:putative endonuclease
MTRGRGRGVRNREFFVYLMSNVSRTLYVGVTNDLERRVWQHKEKATSDSFTARYNVTMLVHVETFSDVRQAIAREKEIKGWRREKKVALIESENPGWLDLSADWFG